LALHNHVAREKLPFPLTSDSCAEKVQSGQHTAAVIANSPNEASLTVPSGAFLNPQTAMDEIHTLLPRSQLQPEFSV
jgi:hypothetical protein